MIEWYWPTTINGAEQRIGESNMFQIRYLEEKDKEFWYTLDRHLPEIVFSKKVSDKRGYVILEPGFEQSLEMFMAKAL